MRLIDADAFLKEYCEPYPHIYQAMSSAFKHAPTVDAIPVEWMLNDWDSKEWADVGYQVMRRIIADWAERKEE